MSEHTVALRARWVVPVCGAPIDGGIVVIRAGEIVAVGRDAQDVPLTDLGDVALLPGLVNAHTHLEFSDLETPLGEPGMVLPEWISAVIAQRRGRATEDSSAILAGLAQSLAAGTTTVGEIATSDWRMLAALPETRPTTMLFHESIGPTLPRAQEAARTAEAFLEVASEAPGLLPGLSPHAPYTVHPRLLESLVELSVRYHVPVAMHLAESREELELLNLGAGPFRQMLEAVDAWDGADDARLSCILDYVSTLARADRALVIHGNYLDDEEIALVAAHAERMAVVYCPRTHAYFEHAPYPLARMLAAGVTMALGTDSRASSPDLDMLGEFRQACGAHPDVPPAKILELATLGGARALGLADQIGTLEAGKRADLVAVPCPGNDPLDALATDDIQASATWLAGVRCE